MSASSNQLVVMNMSKGLRNDRTAFVIDNDAFPTLQNAYVWRGRVLRKRGTEFLGRLQRTVTIAATPNNQQVAQFALINGDGNLLNQYSLGGLSATPITSTITGATQANPCVLTTTNTVALGTVVTISGVGGMTQLNGHSYLVIAQSATTLTINVDSTGFGAYTTGGTVTVDAFVPQIIPKSLSLVVGANTYTDATGNGILTGAPAGTGTINYTSGALTITGGASSNVTGSFSYYPDLPVLGIEDFDIGLVNQPLMITLDQKYAYGFNQGNSTFYDVTFYKTTGTQFTWNGPNYRQFYSLNYLGINTIADSPDKTGCMWVTNGNPGFHFLNATYTSGTGSMAITMNLKSGGNNYTKLLVGDILFFNEWVDSTTINGVNGTVTDITGAASGNYVVTFTANQTITGAGGIAFMMTQALAGQDGIRWYDGDPTSSTNYGWVNFAPPLNPYNGDDMSPAYNPNPFYLVGADIITVFKNRLIFSGVWLQQTNGSAQYYPNRIVFSQVGTPYYSLPLPYPIRNATADKAAWYQNVAGRGGFLVAPIDQEIITVAPNGDVLIYGFEMQQLQLLYTFDDSLPFIFQTINSELGSQNTFSAVVLNQGVVSVGDVGIIMTSQDKSQRIDLQIPDNVFNVSVTNNNNYRVCAIRDFRNEWIYFTYCPGTFELLEGPQSKTFPSETLLYNYRDDSWAVFEENYTTYGTFRKTSSLTWANVGAKYMTWANWTDPWNFGANEVNYPQIAGGNQDGFVMLKSLGTGEGVSQFITSIVPGNDTVIVTSPNHGLTTNAFIVITGAIGVTFVDQYGVPLTNLTFKVLVNDPNTFTLDSPTLSTVTGTYLGGGVYQCLAQPFIQTKQFPLFWQNGRGMRVGVQRFLLDTTRSGQITVNVYSSQNPDTPDNIPKKDNYLIYSNEVVTTAEPNLYGFPNVPNNTYQEGQDQTWHRLSNSFNGDSIQLGFTLSDDQMYNPNTNTQEIVLHAIMIDLHPGAILA